MNMRAKAAKWTSAITIVIVAAASSSVAVAERAKKSPLERKIRVMEKVVDAVLVDSPNVVVISRGATRGIELEGFGTLFTVEANLNLARFHGNLAGIAFGGPEGYAVQQFFSGSGSASRDEQFSSEEKHKAAVKSAEETETERKKLLDAFRVELIDLLVDYGPTLTELGDDNWMVIAAYLDGNRFFGASDSEERLIVKVKMRDLRAHSAGRLSRQEITSMVQVRSN